MRASTAAARNDVPRSLYWRDEPWRPRRELAGLDWTHVGTPRPRAWVTADDVLRSAERVLGWWVMRARRPLEYCLLGGDEAPLYRLFTVRMRWLRAHREEEPRGWARAVISLARTIRTVEQRVRMRALDKMITTEWEAAERAAEALDEGFRVTERQWLDLKARLATIDRLMRERYPGDPVLAEDTFASSR